MAPRTLWLTLTLLGAAAMVAAALLLVGGGDARPLSAEQYRTQLVGAFAELRLDANPTDRGAMRDHARQFRDLAGELSDIVPPADAAAAHAKLVAGLEQYTRELEALADAGRQGAIAFQQQLAENGGTTGQAWMDAFNELAARGHVTDQPR
jgi:predicted metal-dependent phosphoesterase TrpH